MQFDLFDAKQTRVLENRTYADFKKALAASGCTQCALSQGRTNIVVDRGNPDAKVLFIGEAPGQNEDKQGRAFVGRAGRLLDDMLKTLSFDTDRDALIANVVKCRPPENRAPLPAEAAACRPYLQKQIDLVQPKIIVLLGASALRYILPEKKDFKMAEEVGRFFLNKRFPDTHLMVVYHPAYILRDPRKRPIMEQHLKRFCDLWRGL